MSQDQQDVVQQIACIDLRLEEIARDVIRAHLDLSTAENQSFLAMPDAREQHQVQWHQWGILTHTRRFLRYYLEDIPGMLRRWELDSAVDEILRCPIDRVVRGDLLQVSILLHDIGKFSARRYARGRFHFAHHEADSGAIIRQELDLPAYGFTESQTAYIARTAEDHFVLGILRKAARERGRYDLEFPRTPDFEALVSEIKEQHADDYAEIGILFLGDSLAKVEPGSGPERAASQYEVNVAVARAYLEQVLRPASL